MRMDKLTSKFQLALADAQSLAVGVDHQLIEPDHVILTFHLNDYETTPVVIRDADGNMVVYRLNLPARQINRALFVNSQLYRAVISLGRSRQADATAIAREVDASLRELARKTT